MSGPSITVLAGVPGAGKSTYAARNFHAHEIACYDDMGQSVLMGCQSERRSDPVLGTASNAYTIGAEAQAVLRQAVLSRARLGGRTCVDATNLRASERLEWIKIARSAGVPVHLVAFNVPLWLALWRNHHPASTIPDETIRSCFEQERVMLHVIDSEGFDTVTVLPGHDAQDELDQQECAICKGSLEIQEDDKQASGYSFRCLDCGLIYPVMEPKATLGLVYGGA